MVIGENDDMDYENSENYSENDRGGGEDYKNNSTELLSEGNFPYNLSTKISRPSKKYF